MNLLNQRCSAWFFQQKNIDLQIGFGYERIFKRCADNDLTEISVRDAYIMLPYQVWLKGLKRKRQENKNEN